MKGKTFTERDLARRSRLSSAQKQALAQAMTDRYKIVAYDRTAPVEKQAIIAEELTARLIALLPPKARRIVPLLLRMSATERLLLLQAFDSQGNLRNVFEAA